LPSPGGCRESGEGVGASAWQCARGALLVALPSSPRDNGPIQEHSLSWVLLFFMRRAAFCHPRAVAAKAAREWGHQHGNVPGAHCSSRSPVLQEITDQYKSTQLRAPLQGEESVLKPSFPPIHNKKIPQCDSIVGFLLLRLSKKSVFQNCHWHHFYILWRIFPL